MDRVAAEVPDTLLLAEAFWLLEGYFVRTLGMHRVYNSAFMHMLRDEDNAGYRRVLKETLEFDPEILKRYVNFMNNPDEKTAVEQFGKGDKYFGVATLLATLPGLPMLGPRPDRGVRREVRHGVPPRDAGTRRVDEWLVARHEREIVPLLHRRGDFAEARDFLLYDFAPTAAASTRTCSRTRTAAGPSRSLVVYHNRYAETSGWIRESAALRGQGRRRVEAAGAADAGRGARARRGRRGRSLDRVPRAADRRSSTCARSPSSGSAACTSRCGRTRPACSGSSASCTTRRASGAGSPSGSAGAGVASLEGALRELAAGARSTTRCAR